MKRYDSIGTRAACRILRNALGVLSMLALVSSAGVMKEIHVSAGGGSDDGAGTQGSPYRTVHRAAAEVARSTAGMSGDIVVYLHEGVYELDSTVTFGPEHGGRGEHWVIWRSFGTDQAAMSGGRRVSGTWEQVADSDQWKVQIPGLDRKIRNLYVNGQRAIMATGKVVRGGTDWQGTGIFYSDEQVSHWKNHRDIELHQKRMWIMHAFGVEKLVAVDGGTAFEMQQPLWNIGQTVAYVTPKHNWGWSVHNVYDLLDREGEFYFDRQTATLYYEPRSGEDMHTATVVYPLVEGLLHIKGNSLTDKVRNIQFWGLQFAYDDWQMLEIDGSFAATTIQANTLFICENPDGSWGLPGRFNMATVTPGAVDVYDADNIIFQRNSFTHCGAVALNAVNGVTHISVIGNRFEDISATAISIGHPQHVILNDEGRLHEQEQNPRQVIVSNNLLRDVAVEFVHCPGITVFFVEGIDVLHNDIGPMEYTQISAGWGWRAFPDVTTSWDNRINFNKLVAPCQGLGDGGAIYTLGAMGGDSEVRGNYINCPAPYKATGMKWGLYADQGFSPKRWARNVIEDIEIWVNKLRDEPAVIDSNYTTSVEQECRSGCPTNTVVFDKADRPQAVLDIIANAGLQETYRRPWDGTIPQTEPQEVGTADRPVSSLSTAHAPPVVSLAKNVVRIIAGPSTRVPLTCTLSDARGRTLSRRVVERPGLHSLQLPPAHGFFVVSLQGTQGVVRRQLIRYE